MKAAPITGGRALMLGRVLRPYGPQLGVAFLAMLGSAAADLLEPWPLKIIFDSVIGSKPVPHWRASWPLVGGSRLAMLNAAAAAVILIAITGAIASYAEK